MSLNSESKKEVSFGQYLKRKENNIEWNQNESWTQKVLINATQIP